MSTIQHGAQCIPNSIGLVVPCYNEAERLDAAAFEAFLREDNGVFIIFVDDGSQDGTFSLLHSIKHNVAGRVDIVHLPKNSGKAEAVRQGILKASAMGFQSVGYWDADLSAPLDQIHPMRAKMANSISLVLGARVKLLGHVIQRKPERHYLGRIYATLSSLVLGFPVYDTQCGAKLLKNDRALRCVFSRPFRVNWSFDVEMLVRYKILNFRSGSAPLDHFALELPLEKWAHKTGSKVKATDFFIGLYELIHICALSRMPGIKKRYARKFRLDGTRT